MAREVFSYKLKEIQSELLDMGSMVVKALYQAVDALKRRDHYLSKFVISDDKKINQRRLEIEERTLTLIATQQPVVAQDLRFAASAIVIAGELERMGDHAKGIARISDLIGEQAVPAQVLSDITSMAKEAGLMLNDALSAYVKGDTDEAREVASHDDRLDEIFDRVTKCLLHLMLNERSQVNTATYLLWAAHNLERIGDRVTNICERVVFISTGELPSLGRDAERVAPASSQIGVPASASLELEE